MLAQTTGRTGRSSPRVRGPQSRCVGLNSTTRTAYQTETAEFWQFDLGIAQWDRVADTLLVQTHKNLLQTAHILALTDIAITDTVIALWDAKNAFNSWRPVTAIVNADLDGNPDTTADPTWLPLLVTPYFQKYPLGHAGTSSAAADAAGRRLRALCWGNDGGRRTPVRRSTTTPEGVPRRRPQMACGRQTVFVNHFRPGPSTAGLRQMPALTERRRGLVGPPLGAHMRIFPPMPKRTELHHVVNTLGTATCLVFLLVGCTKVDMNVTVRGDDHVDGSIILGIDRQVIEVNGVSEQEFVEQLRSRTFQRTPHGESVEKYSDDQYVGTKLVLRAVRLADFNQSTGDGGLKIVHDGDRFKLSGTIDTRPTVAGAADSRRFADAFNVQIRVTFPGPVLRTNGELDGRTVSWRPRYGERLDLAAEAEDGGSPWLNTVVLGGVPGLAVLLAVAASVGVALKRRRAAFGGRLTASAQGASTSHPEVRPETRLRD